MEPRIIRRPGVGVSASILQQQELEFKSIYIDQPVLIVVERGIKTLRWKNGEYIIPAGEAIAIAGGKSVDIINRLAEDGTYRAYWLVWDSTLIAEHVEQHPRQPVIQHALPIVQPPPDFGEAFRRALQAVEDTDMPLEIARHRTGEMLLWISMHGGRFEQSEVLTLAIKVRRLIGQDLAKKWSAISVASALAMSEATLRRKLADEGTSLSEILSDTRTSFALSLLQATMQPITQIALNCGYQTPSHFSLCFRKRFGFSPSAVRCRRPFTGPVAGEMMLSHGVTPVISESLTTNQPA